MEHLGSFSLVPIFKRDAFLSQLPFFEYFSSCAQDNIMIIFGKILNDTLNFQIDTLNFQIDTLIKKLEALFLDFKFIENLIINFMS